MPTVQQIIEAHRRDAAKIRKRVAEECDQFQNQGNLTPQGKQARQAAVTASARAQLKTQSTAETEALADRSQSINSELFGSHQPNDQRIASVRDARDRARKLTDPEHAARELNYATDDDDQILVREYARECRRRSGDPTAPEWGVLWRQWAGQQDGGQELLGELEMLQAEQTDPTARLLREQAYGLAGALPASLRTLTAAQVQELATGADLVEEMPTERGEAVGRRLAEMVRGTGDGL